MFTLDDLPKHKCSLTLSHNEHKDSYITVKEWLDFISCYDDEWKNEEQKQRAIDTNEIWELHWYPNTPTGFCRLLAPTLEELLKLMKERKE